MKTRYLILIVLFTTPMNLLAQYKTWYWSILKCEISNKDDSAFLVEAEKQMWAKSLEGNFPVYDGWGGGRGYRLRITRADAESRFSDTSVSKLRFTNNWELASMWNWSADTFKIISFEPDFIRPISDTRFQYSFKTFCNAHIPSFYYEHILKKMEMKRYHDLAIESLAKSFNALLRGDTLYRYVNFIKDSNEYLPQVSYSHLATAIQNGTYSGQIKCYRTVELNAAMSKRALEESFVHWDSTNAIEDPSHPGTFVLAPIRYQLFPKGVVIYERWVPHYNGLEKLEYPNLGPQAYMTFHREVVAYGTRYGVDWNRTEKILWHNPDHVDTCLISSVFNWTPYEESFRAERFQTMHIALEP